MIGNFPKLEPRDRRLVPLDPSGNHLEATGEIAELVVAFTELRAKPDFGSAIDTQLLFGERVEIFERHEGWVRVQAQQDNYVGWLEEDTLGPHRGPTSHIVCVPRTFFYPGPDLKLPHKGMRSMGTEVRVVDQIVNRGTTYCILDTGDAVISHHIRPVSDHAHDYVTIAETLLRTPYLWAGTTAFGIDCSGLVKLAMQMCGSSVLRDSDMQAATLGSPVDPGQDYNGLKRGDLIFWKGHVAICQGSDTNGVQQLIHANGHSMDVASEPVVEAVQRIAYLYEKPIGVRRPSLQAS